MAGIISNVDSDVQKLRKLKNEIENVKKALMGINIKVDIDIAKGLQSQLTSLLGQYDVLVDKIAAAEAKIMLSTSRINKATEKIVQAQEQVSKPAGIPAQSGNTSTQTNTAETASIQAQAKAYDDLKTEINAILGTRDDNIKRMVEEMNAIRMINAEIKKITKSQSDYSSLSFAQQKRLEHLNNSLLTHKTALSEVRQALNNNAKLDNATATSMNGLSQSLSRMRIAYRELTEEERNSPFGKELLASIQQADTKIKELDATIGNHQRNVGNYGKQWNGLSMSIQQVGRELPSLAYGPKVFFSAISNNLPILADEIKRARTEYELLKKSGQAATPVWKQIVSSLFSWQSALTVGITLLTLYGDKVVDWIVELFNAKNAMKPLVDIQQQLNEVQLKGAQNAQSEITKLELLYKATQNASKPIRERKKAVDELQKSYPDFFKNISEEEILTGKAADAYVRLTSSIIASARARAAQDKMIENAKKVLEDEDKITEEYVEREKAQALLEKEQKLLSDLSNTGEAQEFQVGIVRAAQKRVDEIDERISGFRREIYETNKAQNELAQNININDLVFNANKDSSKESEEERKKRQNEADKQKQLQQKLSDDFLALRRKNQQDEIDLMEEGKKKMLQQIDADFEARKAEITKKTKELAEVNKKAGLSGLNSNGLTAEQQTEIDKANEINADSRAKAESDMYKEETETMRNYLKEYGTYQQQKLAIAEEYAEKIRKAQSEGERLSLEKERDTAMQKVEVDAIKQSIDWGSVFGEFGAMFKDQLQPTIDKLREISMSDEFKSSSLEDQQLLYELIQKLEQSDTVWDRDIFKRVSDDLVAYQSAMQSYIEAQEEERLATKTLTDAKKKLVKYENSGDNANALKAQVAVTEAEINLKNASDNVQNFGDKVQGAASDLEASSNQAVNMFQNLESGLKGLTSGSLQGVGQGLMQLDKLFNNSVITDEAGNALAKGFQSLLGKDSKASKAITEALGSSGMAGEIISGVLGILDMIAKDGVSGIIIGLQDTIFGAVEKVLDDVLSGDIIIKPIKNSFNHIGNILNTLTFGGFDKWVGVGGNAKDVQENIDRLTDRNEKLQTAIEDLTEEIKASKGTKSVEAYRDAYKYQEETIENYKRIAQEQARYSGSHHSWNYYWGGFSQEEVNRLSEKIGRKWNGDIWDLDPEEMKMLRETVDLWEKIQNTGKGGYGDRLTERLDDYIEQADSLEELTNNLYEGLTSISFDSMYSSFVDKLMDMKYESKDAAEDISEYFMRSMLSNKIGELYADKLQEWWKKFGASMKDNELTEAERKDLQDEYMGYVDEAMKLRDELAAATGYDKISQESTSQSSTSRGFGTEMTHEDAGELSGRFTALQIAGEEIKNQSIKQTDLLSSINEKMSLLDLTNEDIPKLTADMPDIAGQTKESIASSYQPQINVVFPDAKIDVLTAEISTLKGIVNEMRTLQVDGNLDIQEIREGVQVVSKNSHKVLNNTDEMKRDIKNAI